MNLFLTREQHDSLMGTRNDLLQLLFKGKKKDRKWNLAGVTFHNVPESLFIEVIKAI